MTSCHFEDRCDTIRKLLTARDAVLAANIFTPMAFELAWRHDWDAWRIEAQIAYARLVWC